MKKFAFFKTLVLAGILLSLVLSICLSAQTFDAIKSQVREHTLSNGMKWIVLPRRDAPVASFHVYADVGSANEVEGITGISHILEHLAFKGSKTVGTTDYASETVFLNRLDSLYTLIRVEEDKIEPDTARVSALEKTFEQNRLKAQEYVVTEEYQDMCEKQGDRRINASTGSDATQYIDGFPSNRLEFWMSINSDRFYDPVFREFYKEKDVIMEERRLRIETSPLNKLFEDFIAVSFKAHPYRHLSIGHMSDLWKITHQDVKDYFRKYYSPCNLTASVVGDVEPDEVFRLADLYFGRIPSGPKPEPPRTEEPEQWGERRVQVEAKSEPILLVGYHRPSARSKDDLVFDALVNIAGQGRSSRMYRSLVKEQQIAIEASAENGWPGYKYPNLCVFYAVSAKDKTSEECLKAIDTEIEKIKTEPVSADELTKYKRQTVKSLIDQMKSNSNMAELLAKYEILLGDWRHLFDQIQKIRSITAADVQRVAKTYLVKKNRTIGEIVPEPVKAQ